MTLGQRLVQLREAQGWTQDDLAEKSGVSAETIRRIETDRTRPELRTLTDLAETLGVEPTELISLRGPRKGRGLPSANVPQSASPSDSPLTSATTDLIGLALGDYARNQGWPPAAITLAGRIQAGIALREFDEASELLLELTAMVSDPTVSHVQGEVAYQRGDYDAARTFARTAVGADPNAISTWILGMRASMAAHDIADARRWVGALERLFPRHPSTLRARAQLAWEDGEMASVRAALAQLPDESVFARDSDSDLRRLVHSASVVVGDGRVTALVAIFRGCGIRTILLGWRDQNSALPEPKMTTHWRAMSSAAQAAVKLEPIELSDEIAMMGVRVVGMEERPEGDALDVIGMLEVRFEFVGLEVPEAWGGLMLIDVERKLISPPRRLWAHEIRGIPRDDWADMPRSQGAIPTMPKERTAPQIFLSYAREDIAQVTWLDRALREHGLRVWRDDQALRAGDLWQSRVDEAIERADFIVLCLSKASLSKRGYVQVELRRIVDESRYRPLEKAYLIPVRLEDVTPPRILKDVHYVDLFPDRQAGADQVARHVLDHWHEAGPGV
jgi:transcriptional regulator with XRE-family HTH domain